MATTLVQRVYPLRYAITATASSGVKQTRKAKRKKTVMRTMKLHLFGRRKTKPWSAADLAGLQKLIEACKVQDS